MKLLVLASGGDAPGMNKVIYNLYKKFGKNLFACVGGFAGLINNQIRPIKDFNLSYFKNKAGVCIKSSRTMEFKTKEGFDKGLKVAKKFDWLIILGGNGSKDGAKKLSEHGVKTIFIPATIDNDIMSSDYSLGFHTAIKACCETIHKIMQSVNSFENQCCVFEVMGRDCGKIAENVAKVVEADCLITSKKDIKFKNILSIMETNISLNKTTVIIMKEKIVSCENFVIELNSKLPCVYARHCKIGLLQRGTNPSKVDLTKANQISKNIIKIIKNYQKGAVIFFENGECKYL